jgi:diacylglycerol kinase (ATP)
MFMGSRKFSIAARLRSFRHAFRGLLWMIREEHNSWIHLAFVVVLIPAGFILHLSLIEWTLIIFCIGLVLGLELVNPAIERLADKISPERDPDIGKIKDLAAAAVLVAAIASAIVGLIILVPKFLVLIHA